MRAAASVLVVAFAASGCSFGGDGRVDRDDLPALVLKQADLGPEFRQFDEGALQQVDSPGSPHGWKSRFRRAGTPATRGALVVDSRVELFEDDGEAESRVEELSRARGGAAVEVASIGDGAVARRVREPAVNPVDVFTIVWRERNVVAAVSASGFSTKIALADAEGLARKQQRRIEQAGGP